MRRRRRIGISVITGILMIGLYCLIFSFSDQDGEESGHLSTKVTETCVEVYNAVARKHWSDAMIHSMVRYFEHPVRKIAHFSEYALLGILVYILWRQWKERGKGLYLLVVLWVCLSAAVDECHQMFVPGRDGNPLDVLLDTGGGSFGLLLCVLTEKWCLGRMRRKRREAR